MYSSRSCVSNNVRLHNYSFLLSLLIFFRLYFSSLSLSLSFSRSRLFCPPLKPLSPLVFLSVKPSLGLIEYQYFKHFESTTVHTISHSAFSTVSSYRSTQSMYLNIIIIKQTTTFVSAINYVHMCLGLVNIKLLERAKSEYTIFLKTQVSGECCV